MSSRRTVILVAAVVIAAVAAVAAYSYLNGVQRRAYNNATLVKVFVVKKDVKKGQPGEQAIDGGFVGSSEMPQKFRPGNALTDLNAIRGKVALTNLSANQVLVDGQFVDPKVATVSFAQRIPAGQVAVTVQVDQVRGVANLVVPGDKVNIMTLNPDAHVLFQNVNVLAVGTTPAPQAGENAPAQSQANAQQQQNSGLITFAVPPAAAEKIALAASGGGTGLYLTLVPPDNQPVAVPALRTADLFSGGLTPYGP